MVQIEDCPLVALPKLPRNELAGRTTDWQKTAADLFVQRFNTVLVHFITIGHCIH